MEHTRRERETDGECMEERGDGEQRRRGYVLMVMRRRIKLRWLLACDGPTDGRRDETRTDTHARLLLLLLLWSSSSCKRQARAHAVSHKSHSPCPCPCRYRSRSTSSHSQHVHTVLYVSMHTMAVTSALHSGRRAKTSHAVRFLRRPRSLPGPRPTGFTRQDLLLRSPLAQVPSSPCGLPCHSRTHARTHSRTPSATLSSSGAGRAGRREHQTRRARAHNEKEIKRHGPPPTMARSKHDAAREARRGGVHSHVDDIITRSPSCALGR